jgi:hypothetical protein
MWIPRSRNYGHHAVIFGRRTILRKYYFWRIKPIIEKGQREGKATRVRKVCKACMQENLNTLGLGFFKDILMVDELKTSINKYLGGLGRGC